MTTKQLNTNIVKIRQHLNVAIHFAAKKRAALEQKALDKVQPKPTRIK